MKFPRLRVTSIRFRITIFFVICLGDTLVSYSAILYRNFVDDQNAAFDAALYNYATDVARNINISYFGDLTIERDVLFDTEKVFPFTVGRSLLQIVDRNGNLIAKSRSLGSSRLPAIGKDVLNQTEFIPYFVTIPNPLSERKSRKTRYRLVVYPISGGGITDNFILQIAVPRFLVRQQTQDLLRFFWISIPITLFLVLFGGYTLSGAVLSPLNTIIAKASHLHANKLSERLPVPVVKDELRKLTLTLNDLLDRLEKAFRSQESFIANASHQLKTPLAIIRGELEVLERGSKSPHELTNFFQSATQELGHLSQMIDHLLILAKVDAGKDSLHFVPVRLDEIAMEAVSILQKIANDKNIRIRFDLINETAHQEDEPFQLKGDFDLLRTMVQSLIENAVKFSDQGEPVKVTLERKQSHVQLFVNNKGKGIPENELSRIFTRFYRFEKKDPGLGLGLSIAKRIAEAHGGNISVTSSNDKGTTFSIEIKIF